ncbi:uncharacterized protein EI90DRAFT_3020589 [Cantharellus anzutake]|uniref:uncharacterized protein n=1 Tax=Cantharellus anzutake TaxID=1750568 RepID=UPI00190854BD|nr:uncharacterized protein EI90DRAFT_3020589 [Cantharellus anzutake]KAF8320178.1 hypothetical protein EI90DRAFT_3020589 [Cantharellus anzutake]
MNHLNGQPWLEGMRTHGNILGKQLTQNLPMVPNMETQERPNNCIVLRLLFVAASQGVEKVTLLLNSFPVKASVITYFLMCSNSFPVKPRASPLSNFEELVAGEDSPVPLPDLIATSPLDEGWTLTAMGGWVGERMMMADWSEGGLAG